MSPRRYGGWEPHTLYHYDSDGRLVSTRPEPEWDEWDEAILDAWSDWQSGYYGCGHHVTESAPDMEHEAGFAVCRACQTLQAAQEKQATADKHAIAKGRNPDFPRRWGVRSHTAEADAPEGQPPVDEPSSSSRAERKALRAREAARLATSET